MFLHMFAGGGHFATWKQITEKKGKVKPGAKAIPILFWSKLPPGKKAPKGETAEDSEEGGRRGGAPFILKTYMVFHLETATEGLEALLPPPPPMRPVIERHEQAQAVISAWNRALRGGLRHEGDRACFSSTEDRILMPLQAAFHDDPSYYATALHEIGHATGAPHRLNRTFGNRFGDLAYAFEELVAELSAAFLCAEIGIDGQLQHASYLASWSRILRKDPGAFLRACALAQKAADRALAEVAGVALAAE
jgi:antirestriction protein ArdC